MGKDEPICMRCGGSGIEAKAGDTELAERLLQAKRDGFGWACVYCGVGVDEHGRGDHLPGCTHPTVAGDTLSADFDLIRRCLTVLDGSDFEAAEFPSMEEAKEASAALVRVRGQVATLREENETMREVLEWIVALEKFESVTLAPVIEHARAALAADPEQT